VDLSTISIGRDKEETCPQRVARIFSNGLKISRSQDRAVARSHDPTGCFERELQRRRRREIDRPIDPIADDAAVNARPLARRHKSRAAGETRARPKGEKTRPAGALFPIRAMDPRADSRHRDDDVDTVTSTLQVTRNCALAACAPRYSCATNQGRETEKTGAGRGTPEQVEKERENLARRRRFFIVPSARGSPRSDLVQVARKRSRKDRFKVKVKRGKKRGNEGRWRRLCHTITKILSQKICIFK